MHTALRAALLASLVVQPAGAAEPQRPPPPTTAKERLSGKHSDEQRVNDCKVPPERRTLRRPTACPWEFGS